ncbi:universal stress protein [Akkermansiaceae bacterium]|nr:universal stress protein [Akkermansiaceae bacterium]
MRGDVDELSQAVGEEHLEKVVKKAGLDPTLMHTKVVLGDDFKKAICDEISRDDYALLVMGANDVGTLKGKIFGTFSLNTAAVDFHLTQPAKKATPSPESPFEILGEASLLAPSV